MNDSIKIQGAREHNLKNVSLEIPKNSMVVFTGVSGSGKSSMAFDTIYAEGQRRYVESLSSYARQFLGILGKPDADYIEGLSPAISIDQKSVSHNRRSTVGTTTEIYDYLRLLYARVGHPFCPQCGHEITKLTTDEMVTKILSQVIAYAAAHKTRPFRAYITSPVVRERKGEFAGLFDNLRAKGYEKAIVDNREVSLDDDIGLIKTNKHSIDAIIDSFAGTYKQVTDDIFQSSMRSRLFNSVEQAANLSNGLVYLRIEDETHLFSENYSCPNCNIALPEIEPRMFSFNSPQGACEHCKGLGTVIKINPRVVFNDNLTIGEGGILPYKNILDKETWFSRLLSTFFEAHEISTTTPIGELSQEKKDAILYGSETTFAVHGTNRQGRPTTIYERFQGVVHDLQQKHSESESDFVRREIEKFMNEEQCEVCKGQRLREEVLHIKIQGKNIVELCDMPITMAQEFLAESVGSMNAYEKEISRVIYQEIKDRLQFLINVGLSYLTLSRGSRTLSGGESQRIRLASQIGSGLSGVIYVLDEPSIGLHPRDVSALVTSLKRLKDLGNTIIVVEHDTETILNADHIVDFGPKAGKFGGNIVFQGTLDEFKNSGTLTSQYLFREKELEKKKVPTHTYGSLVLKKASQYNLKNVDVTIPLSKLVGITGVSGSGKSTLIIETLYKALQYNIEGKYDGVLGAHDMLDGYQYIDKVYLVDQSPIGRTPRSNPATYIGAFDHIRDIFAQSSDAKMKGYSKGRFSFNVKGGRCEKCAGGGSIKVEMQFLPDMYVTCDVCGGKRYNSETLDVHFKDKSIYDVLSMTVDEALTFFAAHRQLVHKLQSLKDIGLSYVELGRPAPTLSGGEAQRVKLAHELTKRDTGRTLYILDEPTTGLHMYDINKLLQALYLLVKKGNTVIVIEHNLDVIANMDYIIDLGPEGGNKGGSIVATGTPEEIMSVKNSYTGQYLKKLNAL
ncbi:MAG: UvrABC system protein A [Microgenomates bacterium OLB23]|nr:MAG: UvrABC system protein A [Microgenomates bacterium OLB23]